MSVWRASDDNQYVARTKYDRFIWIMEKLSLIVYNDRRNIHIYSIFAEIAKLEIAEDEAAAKERVLRKSIEIRARKG